MDRRNDRFTISIWGWPLPDDAESGHQCRLLYADVCSGTNKTRDLQVSKARIHFGGVLECFVIRTKETLVPNEPIAGYTMGFGTENWRMGLMMIIWWGKWRILTDPLSLLVVITIMMVQLKFINHWRRLGKYEILIVNSKLFTTFRPLVSTTGDNSLCDLVY